MHARLIMTHVLSPLHAGVGQGVGFIDLPIARERATGIPYVPGSSIKGALRDRCRSMEKTSRAETRVFGADTTSASEHAGSLQISDQHLLLLPIRSLAGTFAWVTSPYLLSRFSRDARLTGVLSDGPRPSASLGETVTDIECAYIPNGESALVVDNSTKVYLEDLDLNVSRSGQVNGWAEFLAGHVFPDDPEWQRIFRARFCVVHDDVMQFLLETSTEVTARIRINDVTKTVEEGALWYEEALPVDSVLYGVAVSTPTHASNIGAEEVFDVVGQLIDRPIQLGGKATVGRGVCALRMVGGDAS